MPRPPFVLARDTERAAIDRVIRDPVKRQALYDMVDAVIRIREAEHVSNADLIPILAGFEASDEAVWSRAAGWLAKIHAFAPDVVAPSLEELSNHRSVTVRFNLCACLADFSRDVAVHYLRKFLNDRSAKVSGTVPNVATKAGFTELIPDFEKRLPKLSRPEEKEPLEQAIALLRGASFTLADGANVRRLANGDLEYSFD